MPRPTAIALMFLAASPLARADTPVQQAGNLGLGLGAGTHVSGVSAKYFIGTDFSTQGVLGWWGAGRNYGGFGLWTPI